MIIPKTIGSIPNAALLTEPLTVYEHLFWLPFTEEPLVVLVSKETALDDPRQILESRPFIRFARKAWVGKLIDQWLLNQDIHIHESMELDTLEAISAMVMNNLGVQNRYWIHRQPIANNTAMLVKIVSQCLPQNFG